MQEFLKRMGIPYKENVPLHQLTGINQVGKLSLVAYPLTQQQMIDLCKTIIAKGQTYEILGGLTNTYLCESFKRNIVILTSKLKAINKNEDFFRVECGCSLTRISKLMVEQGFIGYEGFVGIPGTVGAAAINNSGAFDCEMSNIVKGVQCISMINGQTKYLSNEELLFQRRRSILKGNKQYCVLSVDIDASQKSEYPQSLIKKMLQNMEIRRTKVDGKRKSLGTVFVATSMKELYNRHRVATFFGRLLNVPNKFFFHRTDWDLYIRFLCYGHPELAKYCDSIGRFCWDKNTTEADFINYIDTMQSLADQKLIIEIDIKK